MPTTDGSTKPATTTTTKTDRKRRVRYGAMRSALTRRAKQCGCGDGGLTTNGPLRKRTILGRFCDDGVDGAPSGIIVPRWPLSQHHLRGAVHGEV